VSLADDDGAVASLLAISHATGAAVTVVGFGVLEAAGRGGHVGPVAFAAAAAVSSAPVVLYPDRRLRPLAGRIGGGDRTPMASAARGESDAALFPLVLLAVVSGAIAALGIPLGLVTAEIGAAALLAFALSAGGIVLRRSGEASADDRGAPDGEAGSESADRTPTPSRTCSSPSRRRSRLRATARGSEAQASSSSIATGSPAISSRSKR